MRSRISLSTGSFLVWSTFILTVGVVKFFFHEMWKDEWQAWFVSRDMGIIEMIKFLFYEGHPSLFYLYLKPFALLFPAGDWGLKLAHLLPVVLASWIWMGQDRLPLWLRACFLFSYPVVFEYGIVSRGYILTLLLALIVVVENNRKISFVWLFLLCQTEIQGVLFGAAYLVAKRWSEGYDAYWKRDIIGYLSGVVAFVMTVFPRAEKTDLAFAYSADATQLTSWLTSFQGVSANTFGMGLIGDTQVFGLSYFAFFLGCAFLTLLWYLLKDQKKTFYLFSMYWLSSFLFHGVIYNGGLRQWSMVFIVFGLSLLWLDENFWKKRERWLLLFFFIGPLYYAFLGLGKDVNMPFSNSKEAGRFIRQKVPPTVPVVAINKFECTPVVGYAGRPFFALPEGEPFTYFKWVEKVYLPTSSELDLFTRFKKAGGLVIVSPYPLKGDRYPQLQEWKRFDQQNLKGENYIIYTRKLDAMD